MTDRKQYVTDFRGLRVHKSAFSAAMDVFELTKSLPAEEKYDLVDQVRRSSRGTCRNIAEAWFKRRYPRHFSSKLSDAPSDAAETIVSLDFAMACGYLKDTVRSDFERHYYQIIGGLIKMMNEPDRWCSLPTIIQEEKQYYDVQGDPEDLDEDD